MPDYQKAPLQFAYVRAGNTQIQRSPSPLGPTVWRTFPAPFHRGGSSGRGDFRSFYGDCRRHEALTTGENQAEAVGEVTPETLLKSNTFIVWRGGSPVDFELKADYRITAHGNSGINYRSDGPR
jgi:hypothetical protein